MFPPSHKTTGRQRHSKLFRLLPAPKTQQRGCSRPFESRSARFEAWGHRHERPGKMVPNRCARHQRTDFAG